MKVWPDDWISTTLEMYHEQLWVLPPTAQRGGAFLVGEPASHNRLGEAVYACFLARNGRYFAKNMTVAQFNKQF